MVYRTQLKFETMTREEADSIKNLLSEIDEFEYLEAKIQKLHKDGEHEKVTNIALGLRRRIHEQLTYKLRLMPSPTE